MKARALTLLLILLASPAFACRVAPEDQLATPDELIDRTSTISLALVVRAEISGRGVLYTFRTVRGIKGKPEHEFQLQADPVRYPPRSEHFDDHSKEDFWTRNEGRSVSSTDCKVHPSFSVGNLYLAFLDKPFHTKSFELIRNTTGDEQDQWLKYVLERVGP